MYRENIDQKIGEALKTGEKTTLAVWRAIKAEFMSYMTAKDSDKNITDAVEMKLIKKLVEQHKDSAEQFRAAGRIELAQAEEAELNVLLDLLPKEPSENEVINLVKKVAVEIEVTNGGISMRDMRTVQAKVKEAYPNANGSLVANTFKSLLN